MSDKWLLSASQLNSFFLCKRKWAYEYLDNYRPLPSPAAKFGLEVHRTLENYLTTGELNYQNQQGIVARPGIVFLPKQSLPKNQVEKYFTFKTDGFHFHGYIDFFKDIGSQIWLIGDHKTCSSFRTALTPAELKTNIQASIYAQWAFQELKAKAIKLKWIYYRTKGTPKAQCVEAEIKSEEQPPLFWPQLEIASRIIKTVEEKPDSLELPKNLDACFKYGRCPFYGPCKANRKPAALGLSRTDMVLRSNSTLIANKPTQGQGDAFHLYVDCAPIKTSSPYKTTIELSELLKPVLKKIHQEKNIAHYRLMGYGQHVGIMAHYLEEYLKENTLDHHTAVLSSSKTPEGIDTLQTLSAAASLVIRGF